jgi:hypothetical protein
MLEVQECICTPAETYHPSQVLRIRNVPLRNVHIEQAIGKHALQKHGLGHGPVRNVASEIVGKGKHGAQIGDSVFIPLFQTPTGIMRQSKKRAKHVGRSRLVPATQVLIKGIDQVGIARPIKDAAKICQATDIPSTHGVAVAPGQIRALDTV